MVLFVVHWPGGGGLWEQGRWVVFLACCFSDGQNTDAFRQDMTVTPEPAAVSGRTPDSSEDGDQIDAEEDCGTDFAARAIAIVNRLNLNCWIELLHDGGRHADFGLADVTDGIPLCRHIAKIDVVKVNQLNADGGQLQGDLR